MKFPALAIAAALAAGILVGGTLAPNLPRAPALCLAASFLVLLCAFALLLRRSATLAWCASLLVWCFLGAAAAQIEPQAIPADHVTRQVAQGRLDLSEPLRWRGQLRSDPLRLPWGVRYDVDLDQVQSSGAWMPVGGGLRVEYFFDERAPQDPPTLRAGDRLEILVRARLVRNFADPGVVDHRALLAHENIYLTGSPRNAALIEKIPGPSPSIAQRLARLRGRMLDEVDSMLGGSDDRAAVARAMLLGDRSFLDSAEVEAFRDTGVYHVLVLAGLHVGILAAALLWAGRKLRLSLIARTTLTIAALGAYVAVVEDRPPILRAALMAAVYLLGRVLFRRTHLLNAVGLAALLILLARPSELTDSSFLLSFIAVATIAGIAAPWLERTAEPYRLALDHLGDATRDTADPPRAAEFRLDARAAANWLAEHLPARVSRFAPALITVPCRVGLRLWELLVISAALQIGMLPLMAQYFHRISVAGFAANLPAVLLTGIIVPVGFVALFAGLLWGALGHVLGRLLAVLLGALIWSVHWFARAPWVSYRVPSPPAFALAAFFLAALLFSWAILTAKRWAMWLTGALALLTVALIAAYPFTPRLSRGHLEITVLDVGQGDSIFAAFPDGRTMLVDGGGLPGGSYIRGIRPGIDVGEDVVSPFLWSRGLKRLDVVALSHADEDHIGGLAAVLHNFRVGALWVGRDADSVRYRALLAEAHDRGVPVVHRARGDALDWAGAGVRVLWPDGGAPAQRKANDNCVVLRLVDGGESFLLTGDIERPAERGLTSDGDALSGDFLKVPHHGSKTSSTEEFLAAVRPRFAAISVGESNPYGHPDAEVVERLAADGARVFRTDRDGAVTALTDGREIAVHSFLEKP
jgi:competence protein ComEC